MRNSKTATQKTPGRKVGSKEFNDTGEKTSESKRPRTTAETLRLVRNPKLKDEDRALHNH